MVKSSVFEKVEAEVLNGAKEYVKSKVRNKLLRVGEFSILILAGFILMSFGIAKLIGFYFPIVDNGLNFVIFGFLLLLGSMIMKV